MESCQLEWNVARDTRSATLAFSGTKIDELKINNQADDVFQLHVSFRESSNLFWKILISSVLNFLPCRCTLDICD